MSLSIESKAALSLFSALRKFSQKLVWQIKVKYPLHLIEFAQNFQELHAIGEPEVTQSHFPVCTARAFTGVYCQMSKTDFIAPVNVSALAKVLAENAKAAESGKKVAFRHKGFLDLIAQSQGFANFKAMKASQAGKSAPTTATVTLRSLQLHQCMDGQWLEASEVRINPDTLTIEYVEADRLIGQVGAGTLPQEYLKKGSRYYHVVRHPQTGEMAYAMACMSDFEKAASAQLQMLSDHSLFDFNGCITGYGLNGDWFVHAQQAFENCDFVEAFGDETDEYGSLNLQEALQESPAWFAECKDDSHNHYEYYLSALDLLFVKVVDDKTLVVPAQDLRITCFR